MGIAIKYRCSVMQPSGLTSPLCERRGVAKNQVSYRFRGVRFGVTPNTSLRFRDYLPLSGLSGGEAMRDAALASQEHEHSVVPRRDDVAHLLLAQGPL